MSGNFRSFSSRLLFAGALLWGAPDGPPATHAAPAPAAGDVAGIQVVSRNPDGGLPRLLLGQPATAAAAHGARTTSSPAPAGESAEGAALAVLRLHAATLFGATEVALERVDPAFVPTTPAQPTADSPMVHELRHARTLRSPGGVHVRCQQTLGGVPVAGAWVQVNLDDSGRMLSVNSTFVPALALPDLRAVQTPQQALAAALAAIDRPGAARVAPQADLQIDPTTSAARLVYRTTHALWAPFGDWVAFVDARTGEVLRLEDRMLRCKSHLTAPATPRAEHFPPADWLAPGVGVEQGGATDVPTPLAAIERATGGTAVPKATGSGMVFPANPLNGHPDRYALREADDMDVHRQAVTLSRLDGTGLLRGEYADVLVAASLTRANEPGLAFDYSAEIADGHFQEVNAYWHLDTFQDYLQAALGLTEANNRATQVIVHDGEADNSFYSQVTRVISFGDGGVDDSEDGEVVLHEYGHAIHDDVIPDWNHSGQTGALGEGFGDYIAATFGGNGLVAEWDATSYNAGPPPFLRRTDTDRVFDDYVGQIHTDGQIVSAAWWELYTRLGKEIADRVVISSLYYMPFNPTFVDARAAALQADQALYAGANAGAILSAFGVRGIGSGYAVDGPAATLRAGGVDVLWTVRAAEGVDGIHVLRAVDGGALTAITPTPLVPVVGQMLVTDALDGLEGSASVAYRLQLLLTAGGTELLPTQATITLAPPVPVAMRLHPPAPNPFNPATTLRFELPARAHTTVRVYDTAGRLVATLVDDVLAAGEYAPQWDGRDGQGARVASGVYVIELRSGGDERSRAVTLIE